MVIISRFPTSRGSDGLTAVMLLLLVIKYWFSLNFMLKNNFKITDCYHYGAGWKVISQSLILEAGNRGEGCWVQTDTVVASHILS